MRKQIKLFILLFFIVFAFSTISYSQTFGGIGATIDIDSVNKYPFIAELKKGMPAEKMNLHLKDIIIKINGQSTYGYTVEQTVSIIRGIAGTTCNLVILRNKKEYPFILTRVEIPQEVNTDKFAFSSKQVHISSCKLPEERKVDEASEIYKQSLRYMQDAEDKPNRSKHFYKLAVETCNDNLEAHLAYADFLKKSKDGSMRYRAQVYGAPIPEQAVYNPKNWQHFPTSHEDAYGNVFEQYDSVLAINPRHLRARLNEADILYFNGQFDECIKSMYSLICAIPQEQHNEDACIQARRMIRRCEWLKSLPENSIKLNTLYWDKGRAETLLFTLGTAGMTAGNIYSAATGNIGGSLAGAGLNLATMLLQKSKESLKWFGKALDAKDYTKLYEKCQEQLPEKINSTGFYSEETMLMLAGTILGGRRINKVCGDLRNNALALIDIIQITQPQINSEFTTNKFIIRQGLEAASTLTQWCNKRLFIYEELNLYNFMLDFNTRLINTGDESFFPKETIDTFEQRRTLLDSVVNSLRVPTPNEKERNANIKNDKLQNKINIALTALNKKPTDIESRTVLATSYEEQGDYKSAIIHYEYLLNYYKQKKNTDKLQQVNIHLKGCKALLESNDN